MFRIQPNDTCKHYEKPGTYGVEAAMEVDRTLLEVRLYCPMDGYMIGGYKYQLPEKYQSTEGGLLLSNGDD